MKVAIITAVVVAALVVSGGIGVAMNADLFSSDFEDVQAPTWEPGTRFTYVASGTMEFNGVENGERIDETETMPAETLQILVTDTREWRGEPVYVIEGDLGTLDGMTAFRYAMQDEWIDAPYLWRTSDLQWIAGDEECWYECTSTTVAVGDPSQEFIPFPLHDGQRWTDRISFSEELDLPTEVALVANSIADGMDEVATPAGTTQAVRIETSYRIQGMQTLIQQARVEMETAGFEVRELRASASMDEVLHYSPSLEAIVKQRVTISFSAAADIEYEGEREQFEVTGRGQFQFELLSIDVGAVLGDDLLPTDPGEAVPSESPQPAPPRNAEGMDTEAAVVLTVLDEGNELTGDPVRVRIEQYGDAADGPVDWSWDHADVDPDVEELQRTGDYRLAVVTVPATFGEHMLTAEVRGNGFWAIDDAGVQTAYEGAIESPCEGIAGLAVNGCEGVDLVEDHGGAYVTVAAHLATGLLPSQGELRLYAGGEVVATSTVAEGLTIEHTVSYDEGALSVAYVQTLDDTSSVTYHVLVVPAPFSDVVEDGFSWTLWTQALEPLQRLTAAPADLAVGIL